MGRIRWCSALLAWLFLSSLGVYLGFTRLVAPVSAGRLETVESHLDFGTVVVQNGFVWSFSVENRSAYPVEVATIRRSCACANVTPSALTLGPFEKRSLQVQLDLRKKDQFAFSGSERGFSVELLPVYATSMHSGDPWRITGKVRSPLLIRDLPVRFSDDSLIAGTTFRPAEFTVEKLVPVDKVEVTLDSGSSPANILAEQSKDSIRISLTPSDSLGVGRHEFRLRFTGIGPEKNALPDQVLHIHGSIVEDVAADPPFLRIRANLKEVAQPGSQRVRLRSRTGTPFEVTSIDAPDTLSVEGSPDQPIRATELYFDVAETIASEAPTVQTVVFHARQATHKNVDMRIPLQIVFQSR